MLGAKCANCGIYKRNNKFFYKVINGCCRSLELQNLSSEEDIYNTCYTKDLLTKLCVVIRKISLSTNTHTCVYYS